MPAYVSTLIYLMAIGTVVIDLGIVAKIVMLFVPRWRAHLLRRETQYGLLAIFFLSTLAAAGTLLMQYVGGLEPCVFCWYQRVFMYPIALLTLIALVKGIKISDVADYILGLSFIGALFALYQHLLQILPAGALIPCSASDDCAIRTIFYFNFVTIPWMSLTVFAAIFIVALLARKAYSK